MNIFSLVIIIMTTSTEIHYYTEPLPVDSLVGKEITIWLLLLPNQCKRITSNDYPIVRQLNKQRKKWFQEEEKAFRIQGSYTRGQYKWFHSHSDKKSHGLHILGCCIQRGHGSNMSIGDTQNDRIHWLDTSLRSLIQHYEETGTSLPCSRIIGDYQMLQPYIHSLDNFIRMYRLSIGNSLQIELYNYPGNDGTVNENTETEILTETETDGLDISWIQEQCESSKMMIPVYTLSHVYCLTPSRKEHSLLWTARDTIHPGWFSYFFQMEQRRKLLEEISRFLSKETNYYPSTKDIFHAFHYIPPHKVKVILIGQDPYYSKDKQQADGLAFSVRKGCPLPPSLKNIFSAIVHDDKLPECNKIPRSGSLVKWAKRGVLLLNTSLTVRPDEPTSHSKQWKEWFNSIFIDIVKDIQPICVFWGNHAKEKKDLISDYLSSEDIFEFGHPSPLGRNQFETKCKHFSQINQRLQEKGKKPISWKLK